MGAMGEMPSGPQGIPHIFGNFSLVEGLPTETPRTPRPGAKWGHTQYHPDLFIGNLMVDIYGGINVHHFTCSKETIIALGASKTN